MLNEGLIVTVTKENERIYVQAAGQSKIEIFPEKKDEFFMKVADIQVTFIRAEEGHVTELVIHQSGRDVPAKKVE